MFTLTLQNFPAVVVLVVLVGSMLGSFAIFLGGGSRADAGDARSASHGYSRPTDWPSRQTGVSQYSAIYSEDDSTTRRWPSLSAIVLVGALTYGAASVGLFAYHSPWSTGTDLKHLAATLHCDVAERVGLAPSRAGEPGYHIRNDRDRNGEACESYAPALDVALTGGTDKLSSVRIAWPDRVNGGASSLPQPDQQ